MFHLVLKQKQSCCIKYKRSQQKTMQFALQLKKNTLNTNNKLYIEQWEKNKEPWNNSTRNLL